jgi:hypothetical protein
MNPAMKTANTPGTAARRAARRHRPACATALALPLAAAALWMAVSSARAEDANLTAFSTAPPGPAPAPWHFSTLPNKKPTTFEVLRQDGRTVLQVQADDSYGNLVHPVHVALDAGTALAWRWRVERFVEGADLRSRLRDDGAAKLCVFFDLPTGLLPFGERARLALARSATGEDVPSEALCYVWDEKEAQGASMANAFTQRIRMVVLESGPTAVPGTWLSEHRNLLADYQSAFGREAGGLQPDVVGVAISADADNTGGHGLAYFADLDLQGAAPPTQAAHTP